MTVRELVDRLSKFDQDLEVKMLLDQDWPIGGCELDIRNIASYDRNGQVIVVLDSVLD